MQPVQLESVGYLSWKQTLVVLSVCVLLNLTRLTQLTECGAQARTVCEVESGVDARVMRKTYLRYRQKRRRVLAEGEMHPSEAEH